MASSRPYKRSHAEFSGGHEGVQKVYKFKILLPNGTSTNVILRDPGEEILLDEFILAIRKEVEKAGKSVKETQRKILWKGDIHLEDMSENVIKKKIHFNRFRTNECHMLRLNDGAGESVETFQNMWDLTPDTDLLSELPAEYTFETALADLIDNSLQAVWSNGPGERKLVSVTVEKNAILIFDSGPGMDGSDENSIEKWGKMGSSNHRSSRDLGIGGRPPYLMPCFGMFGYGGAIASMHLGRRAIVSSKMKESKKVYILHLAREALLNKSSAESSDYIWRTDGGIRDPLEEEVQVSPHGSFTKVHILEPKIRSIERSKLQCQLKDIYFPYIQCDEVACSRKTTTPIEFQVNGIDLAEIEGGEVAIMNLHSCNGPDFIFQLRFLITGFNKPSNSSGSNPPQKANARLRCVYFPVIKGKESIEKILEKLEADGCGIAEDFESFCRVTVRRLGRLLPDARWGRVPFMESKLRMGDKARILKRCSMRVKCFVETDAGFSPTPSKTDLAHHHPFTVALKNFGDKYHGREPEATIEILKDGKPINLLQLEKEYQDWTLQMHDQYDEEIDSGEDEPVVVVSPCNKKNLGISSDVVRVHRVMRRKGSTWRSGTKVKIIKGAVGFLKNNLFATLEYILLEGFQGDVGGEARLICRPLGCSDDRGCLLCVKNGTASLDIRDSISFPLSVIDSGKCLVVDTETWNYQLGKKRKRSPSAINILTGEYCHLLETDGELPLDSPISAGYVPPNELVAVIRPANFSASGASKILDQKYIIKDEFEMSLIVKHSHGEKGRHNSEIIFTQRVKPTTRKGFHGLYFFPLKSKHPKLFFRAGVYSFQFSVLGRDANPICREVKVTVRPASRVCKWTLTSDMNLLITHKSPLIVRVGSRISYLSISSHDDYCNQISFSRIPEIILRIHAEDCTLANFDKMKMALSSDGKLFKIMDILVESSKLDMIRPHYQAVMEIRLKNESFTESAPCQVLPGPLHSIKALSQQELAKSLIPGDVIEDLLFEMCDAYGNHVEEGTEVYVEATGLCFLGHVSPLRKVDDRGYMDLSHLLRVEASYGATVRLTINYCLKMLFEREFQLQEREIRVVSGVPGSCSAGSYLNNIVFEVCDSKGVVDEAIHGQYHTLVITSDSMDLDNTVQYGFRHGRCIVPLIQVPWEKGMFYFSASHTHHPELCTTVKVYVVESPKLVLAVAEDPVVNIFQSQLSDNGTLLLQDSSQHNPILVDTLVDCVIHVSKKLYEDVSEAAEQVGIHECKLKALEDQKTSMAQDLEDLQASREPCLMYQAHCLFNSKEQILKRIKAKEGTAAAVFCSLSEAIQFQEPQGSFVDDVIGIVALLGTVNDDRLSRVFAHYLTENYMLAVVFKSYKTAASLEKYAEDGTVNRNSALHKMASTIGISINRRFTAICLDELRPYSGEVEESSHDRKLDLPNPHLPSGKVPRGFIGYAVNMINLDSHQLHTRTASGYGLRETLFHCLFRELQVYQRREDIEHSKACIKYGAVSLDGGIMRENGIISLGDCDPDIKFPVLSGPHGLSKQNLKTVKQMEDKKAEMARIEESIVKETEAHSKAVEKFTKKNVQLSKLMGGKKMQCLLERKPPET